MYFVGRIDKEIYKCITEDIVTDEVIITENQIKHIKERHPNDFERFQTYFAIIISEPDYILRANRPNTGVILKTIEENGERLKLVIRIHTSMDVCGFKNSIITFQKVEEKRYNRYIRNSEILYMKN